MQYRVIREDDGLDLGTFKSREEAEKAIEDAAHEDGCDFVDNWGVRANGGNASTEEGRNYIVRREVR